MPTCCLCNSTFFRQSWDSPAEDCFCGANLTRKEWKQSEEREPTEEELEKGRAWLRSLKVVGAETKRAGG